MREYIVNCVNIIFHIQKNISSVTNVDKYLPAYNDNIKSIVNEILSDNNMESLNRIEGFDSLLLRYIISSLLVFSKSNKVGGKKTKKKKLSKKNKKGGTKTNDLSKLYLTSILIVMFISSFLDNKINNVSDSVSNYIEKHNNHKSIMRGGGSLTGPLIMVLIEWLMRWLGITREEAVLLAQEMMNTDRLPEIQTPPANLTRDFPNPLTFTDQRMEHMRGTLTYDNVVMPIAASALSSYLTNLTRFNSIASIEGISNITNSLSVTQVASTSLFPSYTMMIIIGALIVLVVSVSSENENIEGFSVPIQNSHNEELENFLRPGQELVRRIDRELGNEGENVPHNYDNINEHTTDFLRRVQDYEDTENFLMPGRDLVERIDDFNKDLGNESDYIPRNYDNIDEQPTNLITRMDADPVLGPFLDDKGFQLELTDSNLSTTSSSGTFHTPRGNISEFTTPRQYVKGMPVRFHQSSIDYKNLCGTKPKFKENEIKFSRYFPNYGSHAPECDDYPDNRYLNYDLNTGKYCCENTPNSREDFENFFHNVNRSYYEVPEEIRTTKYGQYPRFLEYIRKQYNIPSENIGGKRNKTKRRKNTKKKKRSSKKK